MLNINKVDNHFVVSFKNVKKFNFLLTKTINEQLLKLITLPKSNIVFDMNGIKFIDSTGFETLLNLQRTARYHNSNFILINISEEAKEIIDLVHLNKVLSIKN
ncbi:MAG: STAS domain-containing protein [Bacteroidales bacterium]|jgi:anti-anti-sigma factor|nr:STAS domain-containing protein [Bacteroidales bacterium]